MLTVTNLKQPIYVTANQRCVIRYLHIISFETTAPDNTYTKHENPIMGSPCARRLPTKAWSKHTYTSHTPVAMT